MESEGGINLPLFKLHTEGFHFCSRGAALVRKKIYIGIGSLVGIKPLFPLFSCNRFAPQSEYE